MPDPPIQDKPMSFETNLIQKNRSELISKQRKFKD